MMNAQQILDTCNNSKFNPREFRKEMNITWLINDVKKQFIIFGNEEGGQNSSSGSPSPLIITEKGGNNGKRNEKSTRKD